MDPWQNFESKEFTNGDLKGSCVSSEDLFAFEDNFEPVKGDRLPDSQEYLAILEEKLRRLRADPNFLSQLSMKREDCMQALLNSEDFCDEHLTLDTPVENSAILRSILPQRQALTQGELVELVKYDQLVDEGDLNSEDSSHSR